MGLRITAAVAVWSHGLVSSARASCVAEARAVGQRAAQSVVTCVTCASAVWLVDWMNMGWVSSWPAGIVTCWI